MTEIEQNILEIRGLRMEAQSGENWFEIVKGIDLNLKRGEVLGLIGESGAGKSTLGLAGMAFARPGCRISSGSVTFDGIDLTRATDEESRQIRGVRISYVAQSAAAAFNPAHRLIEQVGEGAIDHNIRTKNESKEDAVDLFRRLLLPDPDNIGYRYPHQVSGGQLQRAMTAMAMITRPDIIIFDEPTTALDVTTQVGVLAAIRKIVDEFNTAAIYITHDLAVVAQMADRIMVLRHGELVEEAATREMLGSPKEDYTKSLWAVRSFSPSPKPAPASQDIPIIEVDNISASYGALQVLKDVSFSIYPGRTVAVVGESGSGKSTVARCVTGLLEPTNGSIRFHGENFPANYKKRGADQLRKVQMIYQSADTALNPRKTIREIIGRPVQFFTGLSGKAKTKRVYELLEAIELDPAKFINRLPTELSGGQKQRLCIAQALAAEPDFIICDEVTSALDQLVAENILKLLDRLQRERNIAYMFITHDLATVRAIADEVVVMQNGGIVEQGPKDEMFQPPHHEYTDFLLSSVPEMDPDWLDGLLEERSLEAYGD